MHKEYINVLFNKTLVIHKMKEFKLDCIELELMMFVNSLHLVFMIRCRYILDDGISSLAYFHQDVKSQ